MIKASSGHVYFSEEQRFHQPWTFVPVIIVAGLGWYSFIHQIILRKPFGTNPAPDAVVWVIWIIFGILFPWFFLSLRMTTEFREEGILIRFPPFSRRLIPLSSIKSFAVREYRPLKEYGGWGIRRSSKYGTAYNVSGNRGVQLELTEGHKVLIGSQEPEQLADALKGKVKPTKLTKMQIV